MERGNLSAAASGSALTEVAAIVIRQDKLSSFDLLDDGAGLVIFLLVGIFVVCFSRSISFEFLQFFHQRLPKIFIPFFEGFSRVVSFDRCSALELDTCLATIKK